MSFLKEEHEGFLKKHRKLVLEKRLEENLLLVSHWTRAFGGALEISCPLGGIFGGDIT
jgi:hypothetical protein